MGTFNGDYFSEKLFSLPEIFLSNTKLIIFDTRNTVSIRLIAFSCVQKSCNNSGFSNKSEDAQ